MLQVGVASGRVVRVEQGVYLLLGSPATHRRTLVVATLLGGPHAAVSHRCAADLWDLPGGAEVVEISVRRWRRTNRPEWTVHESTDLGPVDRTVLDGIPVTTPARTLIDLGTKVPSWVLRGAVDDALRRGLASLEELTNRHRALARRGRDGVGPMRVLLEHHDNLLGRTESVLEARILELLLETELPKPVLQLEVTDAGVVVARLDCAYPEVRLAVEADGEAYHSGHEHFVADRRRRNRLEALGWKVLSFTWRDVEERPWSIPSITLRAYETQRRLHLPRR